MAALLAPAVVGRTSCPIGWLARWRILWTPEVFQGRGFFKPGDSVVPRGLNRRIVLRVGISVDAVVRVSVTTIRLGTVVEIVDSLSRTSSYFLDGRATGGWRVPR